MATLTCSVFPASNYNPSIHLKLIIRCRLIILGFEGYEGYEAFMNKRSNERSKVNERVELSRGKEKYDEFETENMCSGGILLKSGTQS